MRKKIRFQNTKAETAVYFCASLTGLLLIWYLAVRYTNLNKVMPSPFEVFAFVGSSFVKNIGSRILPFHILASLKRVFVGYFLACIIGIPLGIILGCSRTGKAVIKPIFELLRPIPGLAWIPLAILWFGIGESSKYFIICVSAIVSIILNSYSGASQVDPILTGAAKMLGARPIQIFFYITLPSSVPQIFAGLQVGLSSSWMAVIAAEMIRASEGAGWIITTGMESGNTVQILSGMISIGLVGLLLASLLRLMERGLCAWNIQGK